MGEKPSARDNPQRRRRRLLLGGALSLGLVYAILVQIDPMGYGSRDAKQGTQYSALGSKGKKMVSFKAQKADSALSLLREELEELQEENSALRSRQNALLEAIEGSMNKDELAQGLKEFLQAQEEATQSGAPLVAKQKKQDEGWSLLGKKRDKGAASKEGGKKGLRKEEKGKGKAAQVAPSEEEGGSKFVMFKHRETGAYAEVNGVDKWLHATGDALGPMLPRVFEVTLQAQGEFEGEGEVMLRSLLTGGYVRLVPPSMEPAWVLVADGTEEQASAGGAFIFELQQDKYVFSPHTGAYMNVIAGAQGALRGHGNDPRKNFAAEREPSAEWVLEWVSEQEVEEDKEKVEEEERINAAGDEELIQKIHELPPSDERRVISYGLYGSNPKYTNGAIRNAELVDIYFPGWVARFYLDDSVPSSVVEKLKTLGAEIVRIKGMEGSIAGMFWRFLVADDPTVDRYIVRDSDSRLNARDRFAVEEWIRSNKSVHSVRDHVNHCRPLNGGLWGGRHGAIKDMTKRVKAWTRKSSYGEDLSFLNTDIWPLIENDQISHDAYCCEQFPNAHPFPTKRYANYQHVGQVFDAQDQPRMDDINRFIKNKVISTKCRRKPDWIYG